MNIYKDITQQTEEWYALRYGKIGGSSLKDVMSNISKPVNENAIYPKLLASRLEPFEYEEGFVSREMEHGNQYEPEGKQQFERIKGIEVTEYGWIEDDNAFHGISPDGIIGEFEAAIEIKCPSASVYAKYMQNHNLLVSDYVWQVVNYFAVLPIQKLYVVAYRPMNTTKPIIILELDRNSVVQYAANQAAPIALLVKRAKQRVEELRVSLESDVKSLSF